MQKLSDKQRAQIAQRLPNESATALAKEFGVSRATVYRSAQGQQEEFAAGAGQFGEFGVTGLNRFGGQVQEDYNRTWRSLPEMVKLVQEMLTHPIVGATIFAVEMAMRSSQWSVIPGGDQAADDDAAGFLESCMDDMSHTWKEHMSQAVSFVSYGFAPFEIVYKRRLGMDKSPESKYDDGRIGWRKFAFRSQDSLAAGDEWIFDDNGGVQGMNQSPPPKYQKITIPIEKLILYRTTSAKNNPQGKSALRAAYYPYYYSKNFAEIEGISAERMGGGLPVIYLGEGTAKTGVNSDFSYAKTVVRDVRADEQAGVVFPYPKQTNDGRGVLFELVSPPSRGLVDFDIVIDRYNKQIAQTLLSQFIFLGLSTTGTQALAVELTDFFAQAVNGWLQMMVDVLNVHVVPRLFKLNTFAGLTSYPIFDVAPVNEVDVRALIDSIAAATDAGVLQADEGTERVVRNALGIPQRDSQEAGELIEKPKPIMPFPFMPQGEQAEPAEDDDGPDEPDIDDTGSEDDAFAARLNAIEGLAAQAAQHLRGISDAIQD